MTIEEVDFAVEVAKSYGITVTEVVTGGADGADSSAESWAKHKGIPCKVIYPKWEDHGKAAGPARNKLILDEGVEAVIAFWDGTTPGTKNMLRQATDRNILCVCFGYDEPKYDTKATL